MPLTLGIALLKSPPATSSHQRPTNHININPRSPYTIRFFAIFFFSSSPHDTRRLKRPQVNIVTAAPNANTRKNAIILPKLSVNPAVLQKIDQPFVLFQSGFQARLPPESGENTLYTRLGTLRNKKPITVYVICLRCFFIFSSLSEARIIYAPIITRYMSARPEIPILATPSIRNQKLLVPSSVPGTTVVHMTTGVILSPPGMITSANTLITYALKNQAIMMRIILKVFFIAIELYIFDFIEERDGIIYLFFIFLNLFEFFFEFYFCCFVICFEILEFLEESGYSLCKWFMVF